MMTATLLVVAAVGFCFLFWKKNIEDAISLSATPTPSAKAVETTLYTPLPAPAELTDTAPKMLPTPTPVPLDGSDTAIIASLQELAQGEELIKLVTDEEIARKIVRAVYGLSEGRVVREYRPLRSPSGKFLANKIGRQTMENQQELYRISRDNYSRYASYVALFSVLNNDALMNFYAFYRPALEEAYGELGIGKGSFHSSLIKAIDVLLQAPDVDRAILLVRPSVKFKFNDPELENLPSAHKLMLRMGRENSEALKLELLAFRKHLLQL